MRGRKPEPAAVKEAKGNPGRRPLPKEQDAVRATEAPKALSRQAKKIWEELAPDLQRMKFLRPTDAHAFARYCEHLTRWWELTKSLRKTGETYESESNHGKLLRVRPEFLVRERLEKRMEALEDRFGLSPAARQQILQRLAIVNPTPAGDLLDRVAKQDASADQQTVEAAAPASGGSPVGMLRGASVH